MQASGTHVSTNFLKSARLHHFYKWKGGQPNDHWGLDNINIKKI